MPSSNAGRKSASSILSNGGAWHGRVLAVSQGFSAAAGVTSASAVGWSVAAGVPTSGAWRLNAARSRLLAAARTNGPSIGGISDRKSVVQGKSVSVLVDIGGGCTIIKKKKQH